MPVPLALVITELEPGGAEQCLVELATCLDRTAFAPVVYSLAPPPKIRRQLVKRLSDAGIQIHFIGVTRLTQYFGAVRQLALLLQEQQAQVVQTFLFHANIVGARAARRAGVPHVLTGIRVADPRWWRIMLERFSTMGAERHVCVSQNVAEFYRRRGFAAEKLVVIPNGIDLAHWRDARPAELSLFGVPAGRRAILFVGRLDRQKGLDRFINELPAALAELPNHDLLVVGEGPQRAWLAAKAKRLNLADRVHFAGWQPEISTIIAAADLLLLPSRWEGMPNVVLEAMAAGKPVIATQAEGTVELLGLAALEQTVPVEDWRGLRARLIEVARNALLHNQLGDRNQQRAEQFSLDFVVQRYQRLYSSLLYR